MSELIKKINDVLMDWKRTYDLTAAVSLQFALDEEQRLFLNGRPIAFEGAPELESASVEAEHIIFYLSDNRRIYITIAWPEDETPRVESVLLGYIF